MRSAAAVKKLFERFEADKPAPKTELNFSNPFTLVVAVALSAQTTDVAVNKATGPLFALADTPQAMLDLGEETLMQMISSIGLYRNKAKNVMEMCRILINRFDGQVPLNRTDLLSLPGVGNKTASVVLNELDIEPAIAVDTHVYRVSHRLGLVNDSATTPDKVEAQLMASIPRKWLTRAHHWLILHGRYTCTARSPKCMACLVEDLCPKRGVG
ncbi:endonuclease III [Asticcacaulis excentricus]|uniref:Endonuclease III n=1 Tax=Asticcacaulis excentricus (strain ATCC 15261 / DSM 4724 / KCTC 12464 / NCIMB 9791 / VKM B-1370 / CB 48) TaxID=573065 RepID=E8RKH5_ASTEC|nr:endonuclease III [Asticcacaulis excentricus]ADU12455.1 endonuclease III [Asticcacaulis excentricus CB 48]